MKKPNGLRTFYCAEVYGLRLRIKQRSSLGLVLALLTSGDVSFTSAITIDIHLYFSYPRTGGKFLAQEALTPRHIRVMNESCGDPHRIEITPVEGVYHGYHAMFDWMFGPPSRVRSNTKRGCMLLGDSKGCLSINMVDVRRAEASAMEDGRESKQQLLERIRVLEMENRTLQAMVERKATNAASEKTTDVDGRNHKVQPSLEDDERQRSTRQNTMELSMGARDIERFSRQLLLPSFGVEKQKRLRSSSALVVGAGGLGCPAAMYLSACGIGKLGIADKDEVELTNLHRQIAHTEQRIGWHKAHSASKTCVGLNSGLQVEVFAQGIHSKNAVDIVEQFDVILDCSDNPSTRYLISDACVVTNRPLVSGAAIGLDGQLTVYHHGADGPCYRCLFPESPKPEACQRCSDAGVLGVVPGIVGSLQALEAIKLLTGLGEPLSRKLLIFNAASLSFTRVKLRERSMSCFACGTESKLDKGFLASYDYEAFTGAPSNDKITRNLQLLEQKERVSASEYNRKRRRSKHELWDVRPPHEFAIASLPWSKNVPMDTVKDAGQEVLDQDPDRAIYVLCRRGNDSQIAVETLKKLGMSTCYDIIEGLDGWRKEVDGGFPLY